MNRSYRRCLISTLMLTLTSAAGAADAKERSEPTEPLKLTVRTYNYAEAPESVLESAKEVAAGVFRKLGVQIAWADCTPGSESAQGHPACQPRAVFETDVLNLKIISREMAERARHLFPSSTFGFALPAKGAGFGSNATIFYHSVIDIARQAKRPPVVVLGHVLAHELGHLLLGMKGHSRRGIMHIPWGPTELAQAAQGRLVFEAKQSRRIRTQVEARILAAPQEVAALPQTRLRFLAADEGVSPSEETRSPNEP